MIEELLKVKIWTAPEITKLFKYLEDLFDEEKCIIVSDVAKELLKRGEKVWKIEANSLPLGIFSKEDPEEAAYGLEDGDYIVMMTDGVTDAYENRFGAMPLEEFIGRLEYENPRQMANMLMNMAITNANGKIRDDMTVIVLGIWSNT